MYFLTYTAVLFFFFFLINIESSYNKGLHIIGVGNSPVLNDMLYLNGYLKNIYIYILFL